MRHTVAAIFESETQAEQARSELISLGIPNDDIFVRNDTGRAQGSTTAETADEDSGIGGFFKRLFGFEDEDSRATYYSQAIGEGRYLVAVDAATEDHAEHAADLMQRLGAIDIDDDVDDLDMSSTARSGVQAGAAPLGRDGTTRRTEQSSRDDASLEGRAKIPVVEEDLQVGKRTVQRGGVRVYARAYDIPVEEKIRLREEHAFVQRHPVDRPATDADLAALNEGGTLEVSERVEEPVVGKRARVVEEVDVGKEVTERTETIRDKVRKTDVRVEQQAAQGKPSHQHSHLETMEDDPYTPTPEDKPKQQR